MILEVGIVDNADGRRIPWSDSITFDGETRDNLTDGLAYFSSTILSDAFRVG